MITRTDALNASEGYGYDAPGNLTSHTDRNGNVINYTYDPVNRVSQILYNIPGKHGPTLQSSVTYTWDLGDRVTSKFRYR